MSDKESSTRERASFGMIASGALLALILVVGAVVYFTGGDPNAEAAAPPPQASGGTGFAEPEVDVLGRRVDIPNNPVGQPLAQDPSKQRGPNDGDWLTAAPVGTTASHGWQRVYGASVPFSTSDGPTRIEGGQVVGYAHTPQGAALAAAQITYRLNARPADRDLYTSQVRVSATQLAAYESALSANRLPKQQPEKVTRYFVASDAFKVDDYADDMAIVRLASRGPVIAGKQTYAAMRLIMVWDSGDWRLKPSTTTNAQTEFVESLAGWTKW
ncbi:hypothetical protein [Nocardia camponoti]|uniref:DUF8175 domain-containing protein n=1 Tax=Nocardia camponoti TaxID=1616106 RepID=A0A917V5D2_9NOCA|nr:hypothetical protein [Nocardia camponoti]GGK39784.1 hypothetical protein GCM10011591_09330 [Nocardia camponoti]